MNIFNSTYLIKRYNLFNYLFFFLFNKSFERGKRVVHVCNLLLERLTAREMLDHFRVASAFLMMTLHREGKAHIIIDYLAEIKLRFPFRNEDYLSFSFLMIFSGSPYLAMNLALNRAGRDANSIRAQ